MAPRPQRNFRTKVTIAHKLPIRNLIQITIFSELPFQDSHVISNLKHHTSGADEFVKFTTSDLKTDFGQNVVPFIDTQPVSSKQSVPLSGAGVIYRKGEKDTEGYIALKIFTYDFEPSISASIKEV